VLKVTLHVATLGAESAVYDCLVVAWSRCLSLSLCVSVCLLAMSVSFAKRAELIKMPFVPRTQ